MTFKTIGINLPWLDGGYDHDFGRNEVMDYVDGRYRVERSEVKSKTITLEDDTVIDRYSHKSYILTPRNPIYPERARDIYDDSINRTHKDNMREYLTRIREIGASVVRVWIFERFEGLVFKKTPSFFSGYVEGIDESRNGLVQNFEDLLKVTEELNLQLYLCLMDTWGIWANDNLYDSLSHRIASQEKDDPFLFDYDFLVRAMNGLITTPAKTKSYIENGVKKFLSHPRLKDLLKRRIWAITY